MTGNAIAKRKRTTGQTMMYKLLHIKLKIEQHEPKKNWERTQVLSRSVTFISTVLLHVCESRSQNKYGFLIEIYILYDKQHHFINVNVYLSCLIKEGQTMQ
jgi:hypothetical protein